MICPLDFNIKLSPVSFICVEAISKPPIVPPAAFMFPSISKPVADADSTVTLLAVFIESESGAILMCCAVLSPIVVTLPKKDAVELPVIT